MTKLTVEQELRLQIWEGQIKNASREAVDKLLVTTLRQSMIQANLYRELLAKEWGLSNDV